MSGGYDFVVDENIIGINHTNKNGSTEYEEKATFSIDLKKHIDAGANSGFTAKVYCSLREESR